MPETVESTYLSGSKLSPLRVDTTEKDEAEKENDCSFPWQYYQSS